MPQQYEANRTSNRTDDHADSENRRADTSSNGNGNGRGENGHRNHNTGFPPPGPTGDREQQAEDPEVTAEFENEWDSSEEDKPSRSPEPKEPDEPDEPDKPRRFPWWWLLLLAVVLVGGFFAWRFFRPTPVTVVTPTVRTITETITASGQVTGRRETAVGAQAAGIVQELRVEEGDRVTRGQALALLRNQVVEAQVQQARQALETVRAQLREAEAGALPSELAASRAQVRQAEAAERQRQAQVAQARAQLSQAQARLELARETLERYRYLYNEGAVARQELDQEQADYEVAAADVRSAEENVDLARANLEAARAATAAARANFQTLEAVPREEVVAVARQRVEDARAALEVAEEQAQNTVVRAPFAGTVTEVLAEVGTPVGNGSVVRLVETGLPEIVVEVDETNLDRLAVGQRTVITSTSFPDARLEGTLTELGAEVDPARGVVEARITPQSDPAWLRPGLTLTVNIVTAEDVERLTVPRTALKRIGDQRAVYQIADGTVKAVPVTVGTVEGEVVPVTRGLERDTPIIQDASRVQEGERVQARD
ncbi:MAG: hypothetical protein OHK0029_07320 [Armatimonadaceae bacterium]